MPNYHGTKLSTTTDNQSRWTEVLMHAVTKPGLILQAYSAFHGYSIGNQIAAMVQCSMRGIDPGPINTYPGWLKLNRQVQQGQKALWLCMPITLKKQVGQGGEQQVTEREVITSFIWKNNWFVMSQTVGEPVPMPEIPAWDKGRALVALDITETPFTSTNGNAMGVARRREISISPLSPLPHKTLFHEIAHIELGHTAEMDFNDSESTPRSLREVEAEAVALILCECLGVPGPEYCRGYIQHWLNCDVIPDKSAQKVFGAADRILKAGSDRAEAVSQ
jgi:hypothetical protein